MPAGDEGRRRPSLPLLGVVDRLGVHGGTDGPALGDGRGRGCAGDVRADCVGDSTSGTVRITQWTEQWSDRLTI